MNNFLSQCFRVCLIIIFYIFISGMMEISTLSFEDLSIKLEEILKCPICLEYLEPPIGQCLRGHGVCDKCKKNLIECPMCRGQFVSFKATLLTQVVEVIPRTCKYRSKGCSVISFPRDMHIYLCEFRQTKCFLCGAMTTANKLIKHFENSHKKIHSMDKLSGPIEEFKLSETTTKLGLFFLFGHLFWRKISADVEKQLFSVTFVIVPIGKTNNRYFANIKLKKGIVEYSSYTLIRMNKDMNIESTFPNITVPLQDMVKTFNHVSDTLSFDCLSIEKANYKQNDL